MDSFRGLLEERLGGAPPPRGAIAAAARATGIRDGLISRWLEGSVVPSPRSLERLAPWLGVPYLTLLQMVHGEQGDAGQPVKAGQPPDGGGSDGSVPAIPRAALDAILEASAALQRAVALLDHNGSLQAAIGPIIATKRRASGAARMLQFRRQQVGQPVDDPLPRAA